MFALAPTPLRLSATIPPSCPPHPLYPLSPASFPPPASPSLSALSATLHLPSPPIVRPWLSPERQQHAQDAACHGACATKASWGEAGQGVGASRVWVKLPSRRPLPPPSSQSLYEAGYASSLPGGAGGQGRGMPAVTRPRREAVLATAKREFRNALKNAHPSVSSSPLLPLFPPPPPPLPPNSPPPSPPLPPALRLSRRLRRWGQWWAALLSAAADEARAACSCAA
ncbi:unnamed protein product [Closterium sp. NIES-64]|nr:unnamed protein product [Closterium sp. NIES-64]